MKESTDAPLTKQRVDQAKLERSRLRRLAGETKNFDLQEQLLRSEYADVQRQFESFFLGRIGGAINGDALKEAEADARQQAKEASDEWLSNQLARLRGDSARKRGEKEQAPVRSKAGVQPGKKPAPSRLEQHTESIARACSRIAELEREAGLALVVGERSLEELCSRRSLGHAEELITVNGSGVTVRTLVEGESVVQGNGTIDRRPLWARHSAIATVTIEAEPEAFEPVRKRLLEALSHVGMVLLKRSTRDSIVGQCILELGIPVVWFEDDDGLVGMQAVIREEDQRSFTAGAMAELRGAVFYVDRIESEIEGHQQAVRIRADEARANVMRDGSTPLPSAEALIKRLDERCARELDDYIGWAGEQMRAGLNALESKVKLQVAEALEHEVLSEPKTVSDKDRMTVTVSQNLIETLAKLTEGSEGQHGIAQLQVRLANKSTEFWEMRLRDRIIKKSLMTLPEAAFKVIESKLDKESFRAVDKAAEMRMRRVAVDAFRTARDKEIVPVAVPKEPNALTPFAYMKKVTGSVMGAIGSILVVMTIFGLGLGFFKKALSGTTETEGMLPDALPAAVILTIVVYIVAWVWAKRDYSRARGAAAEKLRIATLRAHSAKVAAFATTWHKNLSESMKASLRDTLRRLKVDLREQMAKLRVPEEAQRLGRVKIAQQFESEIKRLSVAAGQAARLRTQLADQQKQLVKNLEQVLSRGTAQ